MLDYDQVPIMEAEEFELNNPTAYVVEIYPQWHKNIERNSRNGKYMFKRIDQHYISDALEEDVAKWRLGDTVFIEAPTGAGKNTFIEEVIIKQIQERNFGEKILILYNRVALGRQVKKRMFEILGCADKLRLYNDERLDRECKNIGFAYIYSYQQLQEELRVVQRDVLRDGIFKKKFAYVICDEAHFFFRDAPFNAMTDLLLNKIVNSFRNATCIYMTATPEGVFSQIINCVEQVRSDQSRNALQCSNRYEALRRGYTIEKPVSIIWGYQKNFDRKLNFKFIKELKKEAVKLLQNTLQKNEKAIFWVNSKNYGEEMKSKINEAFESEVAVFLSSDSKFSNALDMQTYNEIVSNEKFSCKILISTTVLDNGVNINDDKVTLQICLLDDYFSIVQCIGRVRNPNSEMQIYLQEYGRKDAARIIQRSKDSIEAMILHKENPRKFYNYHVRNDSKYLGIRNATEILNDGTIHMNGLLFAYHQFRIFMAQRILDSKEERPYVSEVLHWFSQSSNDGIVTEYPDASEWREFLESYEGKVISKEEKENFKINMTNHSKKIFGRRLEDKSNHQIYDIVVLNKQLAKAGLQFAIVSNSKTSVWTVQRKEYEDGEENNF